LYTGKGGDIHKVGEFCMQFVETPNMSDPELAPKLESQGGGQRKSPTEQGGHQQSGVPPPQEMDLVGGGRGMNPRPGMLGMAPPGIQPLHGPPGNGGQNFMGGPPGQRHMRPPMRNHNNGMPGVGGRGRGRR
jgi:hypothetical protein